MNRAGVLLDTGPLVALLSRDDARHDVARGLFAACAPPLRSCEAVITEACFLLRKVDRDGPAEIIKLARARLFEIGLAASDHLPELQALLAKYRDRPISLADASLIRCAEIYDEPRILTFDSDFDIYRWGRARKFLRIAA